MYILSIIFTIIALATSFLLPMNLLWIGLIFGAAGTYFSIKAKNDIIIHKYSGLILALAIISLLVGIHRFLYSIIYVPYTTGN